MTGLATTLATWSAEQVEHLLTVRTELRNATTRNELAQLLGRADAAHAVLQQLTAPQLQVLEAISVLGAGASFDGLAALDPHVDRAQLAEVVDELRALFVLHPGRDDLEPVGMVRQYVHHPLGLGRPVARCSDQLSYVDLVAILSAYKRPRPRSGDAARQALTEVLSDVDALRRAFTGLPDTAAELLTRADREGPVLRYPGVDPYQGLLPDEDVQLLVMLALLVPVGVGRLEIPLEVGLALRHPAIVRFDLRPPAVTGPATDASPAAATAVTELLGLVDRVVEAAQVRPVPLLTYGGVGVKELRLLAGEKHPSYAWLVLELLERLGLVRSGRKSLEVTAAWDGWSEQDEGARWRDLLRAWLALATVPAPRAGSERKLKPALSWNHDGSAGDARRQAVRLLRAHSGVSLTDAQWLQAWARHRPPRRLSAHDERGAVPVAELRADVLAEAAALGLLAGGAASPLVAVALDDADPAAVLAELGQAGEQRVRAQADLTLVCTGTPSRALATALGRIADVESRGAGTVWRMSEQSLSRAYDEGDTPSDVLAVLERVAAPVPQPMAYLVGDAHRRHGRVRVGSAGSYVVVEDDAALTDLLARKGPIGKRVTAVGLRRVAPGVAVARKPAADVLALLKDVGMSAVPDNTKPGRAGKPKRAAAPAPRDLPVLPLDEPAAERRARAQRIVG